MGREAEAARLPDRLEPWVQTIMRVFERMTASMASGVTVPAAEKGSIVKDTPRCWHRYKGRSTELCSITVVIT